MTHPKTENPTLLLIHGLCCHGNDWSRQIASFGQSMEVMAPTLLGHGADRTAPDGLTIPNMAGALARELDDRGGEDVILCGHSLGCRVALELAAQRPGQVRGIILVDGSNTVQADLGAALEGFDQIADIHAWTQGLFGQMFLPGSFDAEQEMYRARIAETPGETLRALYRNLILWDGTKLASRLADVADIPLLVLQSTDRAEDGARRWLKDGERSAYLEMLDAAHPNCQIITYPDHGHFLHFDAPEMFARDVMGWIADTIISDGLGNGYV